MDSIPVADFFIGKEQPLVIICGPCSMESEEHCLRCAEELKQIYSAAGISLVFKASYDKANRMSVNSFRGIGMDEGLRVLERVKNEFGLPVLTDVHTPEEARAAGSICDIIQIPAFLCRQTDLLLAAGATGTPVNVKKGQFMAPWNMGSVVKKIHSTGNRKVMLTDRGTTFGYNNLVSDMRAIPIMQKLGVPVCFDATHSVQHPGGRGDSSGGEREFIPTLAKAALASGANCLYMEAHPEPAKAKSDQDIVMPFDVLPELLIQLKQLYELINCQQAICFTHA